jgi:hypothetical protein
MLPDRGWPRLPNTARHPNAMKHAQKQ